MQDKSVREAVIRRITTSSDEENEIEVLQKKIRETEDQLEALKQSQALPEITVEQSVQCSDDEEQLLCSNFNEKPSFTTWHWGRPTRLRKLLEGVFKRNVLKKATLTGQPPRAQGLERQLEPVFALNYRAREAIVDFSFWVAKERNWEPQSKKGVERAMSQRLGEIKRQK
ncbi:uncharacterized protein LOC142237758 [Haematobia irritans]|uniref:uncharacterized protein LOC142237758 n=1 Tax=Haematobia irritans TaxID=7368 RepID=UPI003F501F97